MDDVAKLIGDVGTFEEDVPCSPQAFEGRKDAIADLEPLIRSPHLVLARNQQEVQLTPLLEDGGPFRLRRVRRQDRLNRHAADGLGHGLLIHARICEVTEDPAPGSRHRSRTAF